MIRFVIREVNFEQMQPRIDGRCQTERPRELMNEPDAAVRRADGSVGYFVMNVRGPEHGTRQIIGEVELVQPPRNSLLASPAAIRHNLLHSKSFCVRRASCCYHS